MTCFPKKQAWIQVSLIHFACSLFIWSHFKAVSCAFMFWGLLVLSKLMECFLFYIIFLFTCQPSLFLATTNVFQCAIYIQLYHLLTSSVQSLQGNLRLRPWCIDWAIKSQVWDFPVMTQWTRLISYLLHGLFIMDLSLQSIKTNNWSADYFKKLVTSMSCTLASRYSQVTLVSGYPFWQFLIDHNKGVLKDVHHQVKHRLYRYMPWTSS